VNSNPRLASALICLVSSIVWPLSASAQLITPETLEDRQVLKAGLYPSLTNTHAGKVAAGTAQPAIYTEVGGGDVPVSYYHFTVVPGQESALAAAIPLPAGFALSPVGVAEGETPVPTVTLTVYEVGGERTGLRAEWTTYVVAPGSADTRVMMMETATSDGSIDPVDLVTPPAATFTYTESSGVIDTQIVSGATTFSASLQVPASPPPPPTLDRSWNATSDTLYWANGVADLQSVNGLVSNRTLTSIPSPNVSITDGSPWAAFVDTDPRWVLLFDERIDAVIQPWVNADDPSVPLDPTFRANLLATKASHFSAIEYQRGSDIAVRAAEPLAEFFVEASPPSIYMNYEIIPGQKEALEAAIPLPDGFELAPIQTIEGTPPRYFVSLNIYETVGIASGQRAEWSAYVTNIADPSPRYMILEAQSDSASLDPVDEFTVPADVFVYEVVGGVVTIDVQAPGTSFQSTFPLPASPTLLDTTLEWAEANNLIYWRNGVADKIYYNGLIYDTPVGDVPLGTVSYTDATKWAPYLQLHEVVFYENPLEFIASPWNNLNALSDAFAPPVPSLSPIGLLILGLSMAGLSGVATKRRAP
jgi:hypothetical protein